MPTQDESQPLLDPALLQQIDQLEQFRPGSRAELVQLFLESSQQDLARCEAAHRGGDAEALRRAAHSIKGSSAGIGATSLSRDAAALETLAAAADLAAASPVLQRVLERHACVRDALLRWNRTPP